MLGNVLKNKGLCGLIIFAGLVCGGWIALHAAEPERAEVTAVTVPTDFQLAPAGKFDNKFAAADAFDTFMRAQPENATIKIPAGTYYTRGCYYMYETEIINANYGFKILSGWTIQGAGIDKTIIKLVDIYFHPHMQGYRDIPKGNPGLPVPLIPGQFNSSASVLSGGSYSPVINVTIRDFTIDCNYNEISAQPMSEKNIANLTKALSLKTPISPGTPNGPNLTINGVTLRGPSANIAENKTVPNANNHILRIKVINAASQSIMSADEKGNVTIRYEGFVIWSGGMGYHDSSMKYYDFRTSNCTIKECEVSSFINPTGVGDCSAIALAGINAPAVIKDCNVILNCTPTNVEANFAYNAAACDGVELLNNRAEGANRGLNNDSPPNTNMKVIGNQFLNCYNGLMLGYSENGVADNNIISLIASEKGGAIGIHIVPEGSTIFSAGIPLGGGIGWTFTNNTISGNAVNPTPVKLNWGFYTANYNSMMPEFQDPNKQKWATRVTIKNNLIKDGLGNVVSTENGSIIGPGNRTPNGGIPNGFPKEIAQ
ncbi:MAG: hypothetical protein HY350_03675 [Candidatus Omnitrophica bacterium]|nr:hypothetical protein [Candidatus Omnitrophota bacterium]